MFVVGCHRSGTSYLSGLLSEVVGCHRPNDLDRTVDNPRGYFESTLLRPLNDQLLAAAGYAWDRPPLTPVHWSRGHFLLQVIRRKSDFQRYALENSWIDKDPRLALTRPIYEHLLLKQIPCVFVLRNPLDVARSLWIRDGFSLEKSLMIWFLYNRACALGYKLKFDQLLNYESLLAGNAQQLERIHHFISPILGQQEEESLEARILNAHRKHSDQNLWRNQRKMDDYTESLSSDFAEYLRDHCSNIFNILSLSDYSPGEFIDQFKAIPSSFVDHYDRIFSEGMPSLEFLRSHVTHPVEGLSADLSTAQYGIDQELISDYASLLNSVHEMRSELSHSGIAGEVDALKTRLESIESSSSWRFTAPIRHFADGLKRLRTRRET